MATRVVGLGAFDVEPDIVDLLDDQDELDAMLRPLSDGRFVDWPFDICSS